MPASNASDAEIAAWFRRQPTTGPSHSAAAVDVSEPVEVPEQYRQVSCRIDCSEQRGVSMMQLALLHKWVQLVVQHSQPESLLTVSELHKHFIIPLTAPFDVSFVELVADGPQQPSWFCGHPWAIEYNELMRMIEWHSTVHKLPATSSMWLAVLAVSAFCVQCLCDDRIVAE